MIVSSAMHALYMRKCSTSKGAKKNWFLLNLRRKKRVGENKVVFVCLFFFTQWQPELK